LHKEPSQKQLGVLENLYSGTFNRFAAPLPSILPKSPWVTRLLPIKHIKKPHCKGLEAHSTAFSMQY
jgi:hypothetical protein